MALTEMPDFTFKHTAQVDKPNIPADNMKANFDSQASEIRGYINTTLKTEVDSKATVADLANLAGEGRTNETVKGNADNLATHLAENASYAHFYKSANQSIPSGTATQYNFDTVADNENNYCVLATDADVGKIKITKAGVYELRGNLLWASNATGYRNATIRVNGTNQQSNISVAVTGSYTANPIPTQIISLAADTLISLYVTQNSGGALDAYGGRYDGYLEIKKIG